MQQNIVRDSWESLRLDAYYLKLFKGLEGVEYVCERERERESVRELSLILLGRQSDPLHPEKGTIGSQEG